MAYKSTTRPLCRLCGRGIAKVTSGLYFGVAPLEAAKGRGRGLVERPANKAQAQSYVNGVVTSVQYSTLAREDSENGHTRSITVPRFVCQANYWDGESWVDEFFCNGDHARLFGYFAAGLGRPVTQAYADALERQRS